MFISNSSRKKTDLHETEINDKLKIRKIRHCCPLDILSGG